LASLNSGHLSQLSFIFGENWLLFFARDVNVMLRKNIATFRFSYPESAVIEIYCILRQSMATGAFASGHLALRVAGG